MFSLSDDQLKAAQDVIRDDPSLIWYTKSYDTLNILSVVEAVLNYGTWDQTQRLISIVGIDKMAKLFAWHNTQPRSNLHKLARNYYSHYFARYAPEYSHP
jgi:hypothetical protein